METMNKNLLIAGGALSTVVGLVLFAGYDPPVVAQGQVGAAKDWIMKIVPLLFGGGGIIASLMGFLKKDDGSSPVVPVPSPKPTDNSSVFITKLMTLIKAVLANGTLDTEDIVVVVQFLMDLLKKKGVHPSQVLTPADAIAVENSSGSPIPDEDFGKLKMIQELFMNTKKVSTAIKDKGIPDYFCTEYVWGKDAMKFPVGVDPRVIETAVVQPAITQ